MDSCRIQITPAAQKDGNLYVSSCKPGFFPKDAYGASSAKKGIGTLVTLQVYGLENPVKTDIPIDKKMFRRRAWVREFVRKNKLKPKDEVEIIRASKFRHEIKPVSRQLTFIDLFAGIGGTRLAFEKAGCKCVFSVCRHIKWDRLVF